MITIPISAQAESKTAERRLRLLIGSSGLSVTLLIALIGALAGHAG
ncbi:MAG: hypothetical protein MT490_06785 [Sphingomonas sp.]|nr:hypothetical protein [Sphingomonas sp.]MCX8475488.1 hypothetical protein [Sphingomonas sp.]